MGSYEYSVQCGNITYTGKIIIENKQEEVPPNKELNITSDTITCPNGENCQFTYENKYYDEQTNTCKLKEKNN